MSTIAVVWFLIIGVLAGFLADLVMRDRGYGLTGKIIIGTIGALLGGYLITLRPVSMINTTLGAILTATPGAILLLVIYGALKRA